jgi:PmbA protein
MTDSELAENAVRLCQKRGAEQTEVLLIRQEEKAAGVFDQQVQISGVSEMTRTVLRVFRDHRGAVIHGNVPSEKLLEAFVDQAFANLQHTSPDKHLGSAELSDAGAIADDLQIFDERLARLPLNRVEGIALAAEQAVKQQDSRTEHLITTNLQLQTQTVTLTTSEGFSNSYQNTIATLVVNAVMDDYASILATPNSDANKRDFVGTATAVTRSLDGLDLAKTAERTVQRMTSMIGARSSPAGEVPVLFAPPAARGIAGMLLQLCSGPATLFSEVATLGKIGDAICSPQLTLVDDATKKRGIGSSPFDHEGVKPSRKVIIEKGVLQDYLLNSYYGRALRRRSTGNAVANGDARFGVRHSNAYIEPGVSDSDDLIADLKRGFLVTRFLSYSIPLASNFTQAAEGFWIEEGKVDHPVRAAAIVAPLRDMLKNVVAVGKDFDSDAAIASPTLLISKMNVSPLI